MTQETPKNEVGRPTVMTKEVLEKLREAFLLGCTDLEACLYANIHAATLYNYQKETPGFLEEKERLKEAPILLARKSVVNALSLNPDLSLKYLERKRKAEFSLRTEHTDGEGKPLFMPPEKPVTKEEAAKGYEELVKQTQGIT